MIGTINFCITISSLNFSMGFLLSKKVHTFSLYYLLTRVFVNMFAKFEGFGANAKQDEIFKYADTAARRLYEIYGQKIKFDLEAGDSFGPIQGFVLRRVRLINVMNSNERHTYDDASVQYSWVTPLS